MTRDELQVALARAASGELPEYSWAPPALVNEVAPFHDWLILQDRRGGDVGRFASDYAAGIRDSDHGIAHTPDDLLAILHGVSHSEEAYDAAAHLIADWMSTSPLAKPIRTEDVDADRSDHEDLNGYPFAGNVLGMDDLELLIRSANPSRRSRFDLLTAGDEAELQGLLSTPTGATRRPGGGSSLTGMGEVIGIDGRARDSLVESIRSELEATGTARAWVADLDERCRRVADRHRVGGRGSHRG